MRLFGVITLIGLPLFILMSTGISSAAALTIADADQNVFETTEPIDPNDVKPTECTMNVTDIVQFREKFEVVCGKRYSFVK